MRRMITEKDVEKLDSIKLSEIEKLGAMQDPKTATSGQILTADGTGKAAYKPAPIAGTKIYSATQDFDNKATVQSDIYGMYAKIPCRYGDKAFSPGFYNLALKCGDTIIPYSDVVLMPIADYPDMYIYILFPDATVAKYNIAVGAMVSGNLSYYYYKK